MIRFSSICALFCVMLAIVTCTLSLKSPDAIRGDEKTITVHAGTIGHVYSIDLKGLQFINNREANITIISSPSHQEARVEATYSEDLENYSFNIEFVDNTIIVSMDSQTPHPIKKFDILIYANFNHINVSGTGYALEVDALLLDFVSLYVTGDLRVNLMMPQSEGLVLASAGSSHFSLEGNVETAIIALAGSSVVEAKDLLCDSADVSISGTGKTTLSVYKNLSIDLKGDSILEYIGSPSIISEELEGNSTIAQVN